MIFWKVNKEDIPHLVEILPKDYKRVFSDKNIRFEEQVLNSSEKCFYLSYNSMEEDKWGWMPANYSQDGYSFYIRNGYIYKGEISRLLKLKKLSTI